MSSIDRLLDVMARLRDPEEGCPWDVEQDFSSIAPYTIEEAYEVDDAIRKGDMAGLCDELGDLLFQVVFHARMAEEAGEFTFGDVVAAICEKMIRRHPHVFGDGERADWEAIKSAERAARGDAEHPLDALPLALPALTRAAKLQRRAHRAGVSSETGPKTAADPAAGATAEIGERLFALVAEAHAAGVDPELALREVNERYRAAARAATIPAERAD